MLLPNRLKRTWLDDAVLFTSVNVVNQFSSAAMCGIEPIRFKPVMDAASCWMVKVCPLMVKEPGAIPSAVERDRERHRSIAGSLTLRQ